MTSVSRLSPPRHTADSPWRAQELLLMNEGMRLAGRSLAPEVVLRDAARGSAAIRYAYGLTHAEMARGRYAVGAGITGAVLATGQAFIVHLIDAEPLSCAALSSARSCRRKPSLSSPCQST